MSHAPFISPPYMSITNISLSLTLATCTFQTIFKIFLCEHAPGLHNDALAFDGQMLLLVTTSSKP